MKAPIRKPRRELPISHLLPNLVTVAAICAGIAAIRFSAEGNFSIAVQLVMLAGILDGIDGRLARMLKSESALGAELDSLADFLNFGVAPALLMYFWAFQDMRNAGWVAVTIYVLCCVLRLARFNVTSKARESQGPERHFTGVPSPAGAFLVMLPLFLSFALRENWPVVHGGLIAAYTIFVGLMMISRIPTFSPKSLTIRRENVRYLYIGFVGVIAGLLSFPWATLVVLDLAYFGLVLWGWRKLRPQPETDTP
ncbi:MAG: CDP-diacylglycerol--serine O-phosphatidyltransferase [Paracoccaceae bacterium]